ncbi:MAG TPA: nucleoside phosphorylase [Geobacteraceae bacterium]|nr:nucleoside phosphorylase [Geobacteraceae bacterium]
MTAIGLICAIPQESKPIVRRFPGASKLHLSGFPAWSFQAGDNPVTLIESGMGPAHAAAATAALIESFKPDLVLNAGFCGALTPGISVGDLVIAQRQYSLSSGRLSSAPPPDSYLAGIMLQELSTANCRLGSFVSTETFTNKSSISSLIPDNIDNPVIEMESAAVIRSCRNARIPVGALRAVSDSSNEDPSSLVSELFDQDFTLDRFRVAITLLGRPGLFPQLLRLAANAKMAGNTLADALARTLEKLG